MAANAPYRLPCCNRPPEVGEFIFRDDRDPAGYVSCVGCSIAKSLPPGPLADIADSVRGLPLVIPEVRRLRLTAKTAQTTARPANLLPPPGPPPPHEQET